MDNNIGLCLHQEEKGLIVMLLINNQMDTTADRIEAEVVEEEVVIARETMILIQDQ